MSFSRGRPSFKEKPHFIALVDGVNFKLKENETVGLVGWSGCGKTTISGTILFLGKSLQAV